MKRMINLILLTIPSFIHGQMYVKSLPNSDNLGILWTYGLSWPQILKKAKTENRYIFLDCFATWCGPCKKMDRGVFNDPNVGEIINDKFISVKVQMDTSQLDNDNVKKWYSDAYDIMYRYKVNVYPTFLFFSPNGVIVHKGFGYRNSEKFIELVSNALNPSKQYYTLLEKYKKGEIDDSSMNYLAISAKLMGDNDVAEKVAEEYIDDVITSHKGGIYRKENIEFMTQFCRSSNDLAFKFIYDHSKKVNRTMGNDDYSQVFIAKIITREIISPILQHSKDVGVEEPDWKNISKTIKKSYSSYYAKRTVIWAKVKWYGYKKNWPAYTKNIVLGINASSESSKQTSFFINNYAWFIFERSNNKQELNAAIQWMQYLFHKQPNETTNTNNLDTYANLLYKSGRIKEALDWEAKACLLEEENSKKYRKIPEKTFVETLEKMKSGRPTWPVP